MDKVNARKFYKSVRNSIASAEKVDWDKRIFISWINSDIYKSADMLLIYVSVGSEVDTRNIIEYALKDGKRVAVPFCVEKNMSFFEIFDLSELISGEFGIPTVNTGNNSEVIDFKNAVCIVPAICFDLYGGRIGYGGGYYDRFLALNDVTSVGLGYERCIITGVPSQKYDMTVDYILTEKHLRKSKHKEASTYE